jgi:acetyl esterase/lipase
MVQSRKFLFLSIFGFVIFYHSLIGKECVDSLSYSKKTYIYKTVDDHEIKADVYKGQNDDIQPVLIWIHGGALIFGTRNWINHEFLQMLIEAGYTVVSMDYRLAPEIKLESIIADLEDAYNWVRNEGPELFKIDPDRVAVSGGSAGGYLTLMTGFRVKPPPKVLVSFYGYGDITGPWYSKPDPFYNQQEKIAREKAFEAIGDSIISNTPQFLMERRVLFYLYCRQQGIWPQEVTGHDPENENGWYFEYEPIRNITKNYPPTLLLHGEKDTDVPFEQSVMMARELKFADVDYEFIRHPDWGHGFDNAGLKDPAVKDAFNKVLIFLEKHLK